MSFITVNDLEAGYGKALIIRNVDIEIDAGETVAVIGRNGAGKSTLINSFFGGTRIFGGRIQVAGTNLQGRPGYLAPSLGVTLVPQGRMILSHLSVQENLLLGAASRRPGDWGLSAVYRLFPILLERRNHSGTALSGGQQQMLAIGRALMGNPAVLMLDEPTEGLSPVLVDELATVIQQINDTGVGVLIVEQHLNLVKRVAQRFLVMSKGEIIDRGRTSEIEEPKHQSSVSFH
ncbi:ABC transporter ATP-binding protein [Cupriavidus numazuensis]|uniref:High-affinity branched-chain amino acid transport ATP-binding protein LivF n=1 Tax=Cupriavidus numazuensis TaxID=221992 RepID=A0ABM8TLJ0_9BURK|nr:ABC transporter ATP-binding protein [Cupriavidus numazuensis]CAG2153410.1 High-affinity branched-chain amino acid transport ATP-binding protein LivF [Cupriavidus numazuensis]